MEEETQIDIQVVINKLTATIAGLTADLAVKDALIEALRSGAGTEVEAQPLAAVPDEDDDTA